jgi:AsmA protein
VNLAQTARTLQSMATGAATGAGGATDFAELSSTLTVADGVAATENLRMLNPYVRLEGRGLINIGAQTIDMRIVPRAVNNAQGQGGDATIAGLGIPFRISGPWSHVSFRPALEDVVQNQLRDILNRRGGDTANPLGSLGDLLFGRQPAAQTETPAETPASDTTTPAPPSQPAQQQPPRNPLEDIFRRAIGQGDDEKEKQTPPPSPPPSSP